VDRVRRGFGRIGSRRDQRIGKVDDRISLLSYVYLAMYCFWATQLSNMIEDTAKTQDANGYPLCEKQKVVDAVQLITVFSH
jgi:hypothetical protein